MRLATLLVIAASLAFPQAPDDAGSAVPALVRLVAPAYPREAKNRRMMGKTLTQITIDREGIVIGVKTISAHPVFENYVLGALRQWRFRPSDRELTLQVTCSFELIDDECEGTDKHPVTSETQVVVELPATLHIRTGLPCQDVSVN
jgi:TonB family protein